ncbi:acyltransferase family protein [Larkinella sp. GY13]|uniref:acyltransferase family protein n=1 Tax=Larkinella sp. GY13 TaxID=3453720 RepID=UPI003EE950AF
MRFKVLDTFRGIAAIMVIFFHMKSFGIHFANTNKFIGQSDIFVDFFFVLSGFVISYSNLARLNYYSDIALFLKKRFFRLYPLHLFTLFLALGYELFRFGIDRYVVKIEDPIFVKENLLTFIGNLTLTQALGIFAYVSWNVPSWSISAEFYVYLVWAVFLVILRKNIIVLSFLFFPIIFYFIWLHNGNIIYTYDYGLIRCLYGFLVGMITYKIYNLTPFTFIKSHYYSFIELTSLVLTLYFVINYSAFNNWLMPLWFATVIVIFSNEKGIVSVFLSKGTFDFLGRYSYSYYLNHYLVLRVVNLIIFKLIKIPHTLTNELVYSIICLSIIHFMSTLTYYHIELKFQTLYKSKPSKILLPLS